MHEEHLRRVSLPRCPPVDLGNAHCSENAKNHAEPGTFLPIRRESQHANKSRDKATPWRVTYRVRQRTQLYVHSAAQSHHRIANQPMPDHLASAARRVDHACDRCPNPQCAADTAHRAHLPGVAPPTQLERDRGATHRLAWERNGSSQKNASSWISCFHDNVAYAANALFGNA